ncbi:hypothetical protein NG99_07050 [Erwinia typographi]|uniref:Uncharacterized protein n=2 Tax=Erwinia typographi TaxID=371042 RepID=A0A0A3ZAW4_9GAMM|nr:hypothetical protein NG99_07050 [Erwinia typographi]
MQWILPPLARKTRPAFPAWWAWLILPLACVAVAGVILLFTWPVERGFASLRFWFWLVTAPLLVAGTLGLFWLSHLLHRRREIAWRHLFLDRKRAQWMVLGRRALTLAAWHLVTPEPDLMSRITGMSGTPPDAPSATLRLPPDAGSKLGESPLRPLFLSLLAPLTPALTALPVVELWLSAAGQEEEDCRLALAQGWQSLLNRPLADARVHWLEQPADALLFDRWCDEPSDIPRLVLCLHQIQDDAKAMEFSCALLFMPRNQRLPERLPFRPVHVFRPLLTPRQAPEKKLTALLDVQQCPPGHRRHLWDAGLDARARNTLLATLDIYGEPLPATGMHLLPSRVGEQGPAGFMLALTLAAAATDTGQQGQMVVAPVGDSIACVQVSVRPADAVPAPEDRISRYPLAWLGASACLLTLYGLLPSPAIRLALWPWLLAGFALYALLLAFAIPLALTLWQYRLEEEWLTAETRSHE